MQRVAWKEELVLFSTSLPEVSNVFTFGFLGDQKGDRLKGAVRQSSP